MARPRLARQTINFIDEYCAAYRNLFSDVRSFEAFKHLHIGMISDLKRKTLPAIAEIVGLPNSQSLHHFLSKSPWSALQRQKPEVRVYVTKIKRSKNICNY
jgi:SRSO17 transposase